MQQQPTSSQHNLIAALRIGVAAGLFALVCLLLAPPAIAQTPPPLSAYGALPSVEVMAVSPSGTGLAFVVKVKGKRRLIVTGPGGKIRSTASVDDLKVRNVHWAGDDMLWLHTTYTQNLGWGFTTDQQEFSRAILFHPDSGKTEIVFQKRRKVLDAIFGYFGTRQINGKWMAYFGGYEMTSLSKGTQYVFNGARRALYSVDLKKNFPKSIGGAPREGHNRTWLVDGNGAVGATLDITRGSGEWTIQNKARDIIASGVAPSGSIGLVAFGRTPDTVIYSTNHPTTANKIWMEVPLAGGQPREVLADARIDEFFTNANDGTLLGYLDSSGAAPKPVFFAPHHQAILDKLYRAFPNHDLSIINWTPSLSHFVVRRRGNGDSGTYYVVDMINLSANPVGFERPLIYPEHVGPISTIEYTAADGLEMDGILTLPPGRTPANLPVIMFPHGGPTSANWETFDWWAQAFASRGYAVFQPNFRGSTNRDGNFRRAGAGEWGRKMQTDISDGLNALAARGIVNPDRACIMGASYGGYAALAGVTLQQGLYRCAVAVAPVSDIKAHFDYVNQSTDYSMITRRAMLEKLGQPEKFDDVSPLRFAAAADAPIMLIHGRNDDVVEYDHSADMARALTRARKPHVLVPLDEEDHWLSRSPTRMKMLEAAMQFIQIHNPPDP